LVLIFAAAASAAAQTSRFGEIDASVPTSSVIFGEPVFGELSSNDVETDDGSYIDWYSLRVSADEGLRIELESSDFDTYLVVRKPDGSELTNDDAEMFSTDSAITTIAGSSGELFVGVTSFGFASTGSYTLSVASNDVSFLSPGDEVNGVLDAPTVTYQLQAEPGEVLEIVLRSDFFDTYLELEDSDGNYFYNDDAEGISTSRLYYTVAGSGQAQITVSSYSDDFDPSFVFTVEVMAMDLPDEEYPSGYELSDGEQIETVLLPTSSSGDYIEKLYTFSASAGEELQLDLSSFEFDTFLTVYGPSGQFFDDDDGGDGSDSMLRLIAPETGLYEVRVSSFGGDDTGSYTLSFARLGVADTLLRQEGELTRDDEQDVRGNYFDVVELDLAAGDQITIELQSQDFDTYLTLWIDGALVARDDDGGGGSDSRIVYTADQSVTATIYITTFSSDTVGSYTILVYR
jgi:hypothetical protein